MRDHYDCIVIGAGPAGCTAAGLVAESGASTLLLEREKFPRFHVGESLMPETYWPLKRLGVIDRMKDSQFTRKHSVQFVTNRGKESDPFMFMQHDQRDSSLTWQVERADFDKMLFDRAAELGADCRDEIRVLKILFDPTDESLPEAERRCIGVRIREPDGTERDIASQVVMDGSGQQSLIASALGLKNVDDNLKKSAVWGYWRDAVRDEGDNQGATIIMHTEEKDSWVWFIPLANGITSIGCVGDNDYMLKRNQSIEETYTEEVGRCPGLTRRLMNAERVGKAHVAKEFTYTTSQHAGSGWVLIGDAFGFIDPIYSSGVYFALVTGEKAADAVIEGLASENLSGEQLSTWCEDFKAGAKWVRKLVDAFYTKEFSFGGFMKEHPQFQGNLTDLLIGRIFHDGVGDIFDEMDPAMRKSVEMAESA
jgi:flavin-dependent dehydrogenase